MAEIMGGVQDRRLLVVDDDRSQLRTLTAIMKGEGFEVLGCSTGFEALEHFNGGGIGVAIVDLRLPDIGGIELLERLQDVASDVHVILHTAFSSFESAKSAVNGGAFAYVEKTDDPDELVRQVHRAFRGRLQRYAEDLESAVAQRTRELEAALQELKLEIADRKRVEAALRRSEKMQAEAEKLAATGRMAARVAHEINNPLAGIKNSFCLIKDAVPEDHPDHDLVGRIEREIDRIAHIVRQMYKLHSPRAQTPTDVPVEETIRDVLLMLEPLHREHEVAMELAPVSPELIVKVPEGSLQQVLYNLTVNAIQASPRSGVVNIAAEPVDEDYVRISIRDQGPGIPAQVQDRMFEPFFSGDPGGATQEGIGLGLSIVNSIVETLGGEIDFESRLGEGTCFHVYLPSKQP